MADPARVRALAGERFGADLSEDGVQLLVAVREGRVHRYRRNQVTMLTAGEDLEHDGHTHLGGYRRAAARLAPLDRRGLVALDVPPHADEPGVGKPDSWPWALTDDGVKALARAAPRYTREQQQSA